jgi:eukaryotic-like serine/threonine-protein kinase
MFESPSAENKQTPNEIIGQMAGEYRLRRKLGEGGFGAVYEAEHPLLKRRAAVKVLHRAAGRDSEAVLRFISEAQAANQIRSRHIIDTFSFGQLPDGRHFYVMDLLEGEPLDRCLARHGRFDVSTALQLLRPIAQALDAAHAAGIVHRDLKPQNIFLTWELGGETVPKLLDFGMAKLLGDSPIHTQSGTPMGTPLYMSPEQARGDKVDGRSDVYALGVLCHELLTGRLPITGDSTVVVLMAHLVQIPPKVSDVCPDLPSDLDAPILRMLDKDPKVRPATAGAALGDLVKAAERTGHVIPSGMPHLARPVPVPHAHDTDEVSVQGTHQASAGGRGHETAPGGSARSTPAIGRRRFRIWLFSTVLVAAGIGAVYLVGNRMTTSGPANLTAVTAPSSSAHAPAPVVAPPVATPPSNVPAVASPVAISPTTISLTVRGAPKGARVWVAGKMIGEAPGPMPLPIGETPLQLTVTAAAHESMTLDVVPNGPVSVSVKLKKRGTGTAPRAPIPSDLESPF